MNEAQPLLSICIPTYNRAELLKQCLESITTEAKPYSNMVEIIVSNNCSTDHTSQVIVDYLKFENINYHEQPKNLGGTGNIDYLIRHLARGEFCWIIGDDDLLRIGAVAKVLSIIENNNYDFIFVNHSYEWNRNFNEIAEITHQKLDDIKSPLCSVYEDKVVERWEDIISLSDTPALYTSIVSSIFRKNTWSHICLPEFNHLEKQFPSLEATFPHTYILAKHNVGKPCYFIGFPYVAFFIGSQEWLSEWNFLLLKYVLELSDLFESLGARKSMVKKYRETVFKNSQHNYLNVLLVENRSLGIFVKHLIKYCKYSEYWKMLIINIKLNVNLRSHAKKALARLAKRKT